MFCCIFEYPLVQNRIYTCSRRLLDYDEDDDVKHHSLSPLLSSSSVECSDAQFRRKFHGLCNNSITIITINIITAVIYRRRSFAMKSVTECDEEWERNWEVDFLSASTWRCCCRALLLNGYASTLSRSMSNEHLHSGVYSSACLSLTRSQRP